MDANQSLLLMRTAAQELRLTPRFEIDTRERAAPLAILLDVLMLICFVREGRRGGAACSAIAVSCPKSQPPSSENLPQNRSASSGVR